MSLPQFAEVWYDFKKEVERIRNRRLSLAVQDEWEPYFKQNAAELATIRNEMLSIENRIDETVYS
jgi:lysyl-tRNA synthetase class II